MSAQEFRVLGMSCGHCVGFVTEELARLSGVRNVAIDLTTGVVTLTSDAAQQAGAIRAAVEEAGYELADDDIIQPGTGNS